MTAAKVSAIVLAQNEADQLQDCLNTLAWADERLVIDGFSVDGTPQLDLAGARLIQRHFTNFAEQRDAALRLASHDWVLFVDADERIPIALRDEIQTRVGCEPVVGYRVPRHNRILGRWMRGTGWAPDFQFRIMDRRRASYDFDRPVHELVVATGDVGQLNHPIEHFSYGTVREFRFRQRRYAELVAEGLFRTRTRRRRTAIILQPIREFWRRLVVLKGYRDGAIGVLLAALMAEHVWWVQRGLRARWRVDDKVLSP